MTKIPFLSQNSLIPNKIRTETNNHIRAHINGLLHASQKVGMAIGRMPDGYP